MREYNNKGKLVFEGEYLNGKPSNNKIYNNDNIKLNLYNGLNQVKKYEYGKLIFDGVYLYKEKLIRKGKEYYYNGVLEFEGEYLNGKNGMEKYIILKVIYILN